MNLFQYYLWMFGIRFHLWTVLVLGCQLMIMVFLMKKYGIQGLVISVLSVTFSIHFYETIHAFFSWHAVGVVGASLWKFNIPVVIGLSIMLYFYNKRFSIIRPAIGIGSTSLLFNIITMAYLYREGFFSTLNHDWAWGMSKVTISLFVVSLFIGEKRGTN